MALLGACSSEPRPAVEGVLVFDEEVALTRGERVDTTQRDIPVDGRATFVAIVDEGNLDVKLRLSHEGMTGIAAASVEVDSNMLNAGIEIAVLDAPGAGAMTVSIESPLDFDVPGKVRLKILRYAAEPASSPRVAGRIAALRAWTAATDAQLRGEDLQKTALPRIDVALEHLESVDGDPLFAAWGRLFRSRINYRRDADRGVALADARLAAQGFAALGEARNAARARFVEAATLIEIATDGTAVNPNAAEAAQEAGRLLNILREDAAMSAFERARCVGWLGALYYNKHELPMARSSGQTALALYREIGYRHGRRQVLTNLGVLAGHQGDYAAATRYLDLVIPEVDQIGDDSQRLLVLYNAAEAATNSGNTDRAIDLLLRALDVARELKLAQGESLVLHGLGRTYWARGDTAQSATLLGEALKVQRTQAAGIPLIISLRANGTLAREIGDFKTAIRLHREAASLSFNAQLKLSALLALALDYAAVPDYERAIANCREALSITPEQADSYGRTAVQLVLAEALLAQPHRTPQAVSEATTLIHEALATAVRRADTTMELKTRRLLGQSLVARGADGEAREEYERAIALIFKYRSTTNNPELRAATLAEEQQTIRGYVDLLMHEVARREPGTLMPVSADQENALRTLEWSRALNFDAARVSQIDGEMQVRLAELLTQMAGKRVRIAALLEREPVPARQLEDLQLDIAKLRAEVDRLRAAASRKTKTAIGTPTAGEAWPDLPKGIAQLSYALETKHPYVWVRDSSGIRAARLAATPEAIARDLKKHATAIRERTPARADEWLDRLAQVLLPRNVLADGCMTLEIVTEERIAGLPFAALTTDGTEERLADRRSIVMITSLFDARAPARARPAPPIGLVALAGDTRPTAVPAAQVFPALRNTAAEVRAIAAMFQRDDPKVPIRLLFGADGSAGNLKKAWQNGVGVIHFATHGLADLQQPLTSLLLLPALDADGSPTYLTAGQVQEWRGDADLVFLSACDTAAGGGMQRAFLRAGARSVIATLWPVEDVYASQFATDFYRRYTAGTPASVSLSETQRAWAAPLPGTSVREQAFRRMTAWAHVYYDQ